MSHNRYMGESRPKRSHLMNVKLAKAVAQQQLSPNYHGARNDLVLARCKNGQWMTTQRDSEYVKKHCTEVLTYEEFVQRY